MNTLFLNRAACIAGIASLTLLTACGGGGSGTTSEPAFLYTTNAVTDPVLTLSRTDSDNVSRSIQVIISEGSCADTGPGVPLNPMIMNEISRYGFPPPDSPTSETPLPLTSKEPLPLTGLQLPASIDKVLVTVVDGNSIAYNKEHAVSSLNGLSVKYLVPKAGEIVEPSTDQFDLCPQPPN